MGFGHFLSNKQSFLAFQRHHKKVKRVCTLICGWDESSKAWIISRMVWWLAAKLSVLMYQGLLNHAALEKGHRKNKCISSSTLPQRAQSCLMYFDNLLALLLVGSAFLKRRQTNVWTLGIMCFTCQTWSRRVSTGAGTIFGCWLYLLVMVEYSL